MMTEHERVLMATINAHVDNIERITAEMQEDLVYWKAQAEYLAAMLALVPVEMRKIPTEEDMGLAHDILAQYSWTDR